MTSTPFDMTDLPDELVLPDDLVELASQLSDDADHLVAAYPVNVPKHLVATMASLESISRVAPVARSFWMTPFSTRASVLLGRLGAVAAVLLLSVSGWYAAGLPWFNDSTDPQISTSSQQPISSSLLAANGSTDSRLSDSHALFGSSNAPTNPTENMVVPIQYFEMLSGTEQEAVLDLMEQTGVREDSLSF